MLANGIEKKNNTKKLFEEEITTQILIKLEKENPNLEIQIREIMTLVAEEMIGKTSKRKK